MNSNYDMEQQLPAQKTSCLQAPRLIIDGPFGAPAQEHVGFKTVVLIGMGVGITPMLSIMRDTLHCLAASPQNPPGLQVGSCWTRVVVNSAAANKPVRGSCCTQVRP